MSINWERYNDLIALRDSGQVHEAISGLSKLAETDDDPSTKAIVLIGIANGLRQLKFLSDARRKIAEACTLLGPKHEYYPRAVFQAALLDMDEKDWKGALKKLDYILEKYESVLHMEDHRDILEEIQRRQGMALTKLKRFREARPLLQSVRVLEYDRAATLCYLGVCDFELADYDGALEVYDELLSLHPCSVFRAYAHYHRGIILFKRGQLARGKAEFEQCLACPDRGEIQAENLLGWLIDTCKGLNLTEDVTRYATLLRKLGGGTPLE
jgi:tetratricopeptide (TPR) repeat protein